uniref:Uncharacterized protein n=1 Tax=Aegilops tauschii subsp. strangulata TaxID=200361 RepID=A0A453PQ82_AEGTS
REPTRLETLVQRLRESLVPARRQREEETTPPPPPRGRAPPPPPRGRAPPARGGAPTPPPDSARRRRYSSSVLAFSPVFNMEIPPCQTVFCMEGDLRFQGDWVEEGDSPNPLESSTLQTSTIPSCKTRHEGWKGGRA